MRFFLLLLLSVAAILPVMADSPKTNLPFKEQQKNIVALQDQSNYKGLRALGEQLIEGVKSYSPDESRRLIVQVCSALVATDFGDFDARPLASQLALRALSDDAAMPYWFKVKLVSTFDYSKPQQEHLGEWIADRQKKAEIITGIWRNLSGELKDFDPAKKDFVYQVPLPKGTGLMQGVAPNAIQDPVLRKKYYDQVVENSKKSQAYFDKIEKLDALNLFLPVAETGLIYLYTIYPYNEKEIKTLLNGIKDDDKTKSEIVAAVEQARRLTLEGVSKDPFATPPATEEKVVN